MHEARHILDVKKQQIEDNLAVQFAEVGKAIMWAMACLQSRDRSDCDALIRNDATLNDRRRLIEQDCLVAIASQQPVAHDLRDIIADMRISTELERMGDYASDIAANVMQLSDNALDAVGKQEILTMSKACLEMLEHAARAHQQGDVMLARGIGAADNVLDAQLKHVVALVLAAMRGVPSLVDDGSRMLWIAHNLERFGDRTTNIAEQVVFRVEGEPIDLD